MSEMIERVARALAERTEPGFWDRINSEDHYGSPPWRRHFIADAKVAVVATLEALRTCGTSMTDEEIVQYIEDAAHD